MKASNGWHWRRWLVFGWPTPSWRWMAPRTHDQMSKEKLIEIDSAERIWTFQFVAPLQMGEKRPRYSYITHRYTKYISHFWAIGVASHDRLSFISVISAISSPLLTDCRETHFSNHYYYSFRLLAHLTWHVVGERFTPGSARFTNANPLRPKMRRKLVKLFGAYPLANVKIHWNFN